jgi:hypothetical protein
MDCVRAGGGGGCRAHMKTRVQFRRARLTEGRKTGEWEHK